MAAFTEQQKTEFSMQKWYDLSGKTAVVTGGITGLGLAITRCLVSAGAKVIALSRTDEKQGNEILKEFGGKAVFYQFDITDTDHAQEIADKIQKEQGPVDILVNNAGITRDDLLMRMKESDFDAVINTNLKGTFNTIRHLSRYLLKQRAGKIINISSVSGILGNAGQSNYAASKAGVIGLTKSVARELASRGICVNAVAPGFVETEMTAVLPEKTQEELKKQIPLGRAGQVQDIANAVAFLASPESDYITGQILSVDGGMAI